MSPVGTPRHFRPNTPPAFQKPLYATRADTTKARAAYKRGPGLYSGVSA